MESAVVGAGRFGFSRAGARSATGRARDAAGFREEDLEVGRGGDFRILLLTILIQAVCKTKLKKEAAKYG